MGIFCRNYDSQFAEVLNELSAIRKQNALILSNQQKLLQGEVAMSQQLDDLTTQVAANTTVEESAVTLINGIAAQLAAAGTDPVKLTALKNSLSASAGDLAAAITANTPAPPATT